MFAKCLLQRREPGQSGIGRPGRIQPRLLVGPARCDLGFARLDRGGRLPNLLFRLRAGRGSGGDRLRRDERGGEARPLPLCFGAACLEA